MIVGSCLAGGCLPDGGIQFIEEIAADDATNTRADVLGQVSSTNIFPTDLGDIAGNIGSVRYAADDEKRPYLLTGDLRSGIAGGEALHLPQPPSTAPRTVSIAPFNPSQWTSVRVYDVGECSAPPDPTFATQLFWPEIAELFVGALDKAIATSSRIRNGKRGEPARFTPVLRAIREYDDTTAGRGPADSLSVSAVYDADNVGGAFGCDDVRITISFTLGHRRVPGVIHVPQFDTGRSCIGPFVDLALDDGFTYDFRGVLRDLVVTAYSDFCLVQDSIRDGIEAALRDQLPVAFTRAIRDALLVNPRDFGAADADVRSCRCDAHCATVRDGSVYDDGGRRSRCKVTDPRPGSFCGECWIQLEADRLSFRPEGLEVVLAEDTRDPQHAFMSGSVPGRFYLCDPGRASVPSSRDPRLMSLAGAISVETGLDLSDPAPFCAREGR